MQKIAGSPRSWPSTYCWIAPMKLPRCLRPVGWMPEKMIGASISGSLCRLGGRHLLGAALRVLDAEAGGDAAEDHQQAGDQGAEVEGRGRSIGGGGADSSRLGRGEALGAGHRQRLRLGVGHGLRGSGGERRRAEV